MERRYEYAPASTLPGLLQRGRGQGALIAAEDPAAAAELVYGCIRWEWRWDPTVDERHRYLARLVRDLELPLGPVVELLAGGEAVRGRAARVLELLALGGSVEAREALRACPREGGRGPSAGPAPAGGAVPEHGERRDPEPEEEGAEPDLAALVAELERAWVDRSWCGPALTARRLARFGPEAADAASLLRRFWLYTPHSSERAGYLEALAALGSAGTGEAFTESLRDCEARARLLGVRHAPDTPYVRARLVSLVDDPIELPGVRDAAGERLAGLGWTAFERAGTAFEEG
ncbi:hypothetical protein AB0O91_15240 [Kitasatospora sp. NPDC089797]|uniref:hypothetical protein n=1 Tax=Kitasatospora sp. NPDC089797 TaxID=3155298 RepID=UPI0034226787